MITGDVCQSIPEVCSDELYRYVTYSILVCMYSIHCTCMYVHVLMKMWFDHCDPHVRIMIIKSSLAKRNVHMTFMLYVPLSENFLLYTCVVHLHLRFFSLSQSKLGNSKWHYLQVSLCPGYWVR